MFRRALFIFFLCSVSLSVFSQKRFTVVKDLRDDWMQYDGEVFQPLMDFPITGLSTVYFRLNPVERSSQFLRLKSAKTYFVFVNGKIKGEYDGESFLRLDSLLHSPAGRPALVAIHQRRINERDLVTEVVSRSNGFTSSEVEAVTKPYFYFRDFVVIAGLLVIALFVFALRVNPKLAPDYFSISRIFTMRDADDSQASARLTAGSNVQFYVLCSLMIGFYLMIVLYNLPAEYVLPTRFQASTFWMMWLQWLKLSALVFVVLISKIFLIFATTHLFGMRGLARFHFFNWMRLLLVVLGVATVAVFTYFIARGDGGFLYVMFLAVVVMTLTAWIVVAFFKLGGKSGHSIFHLFSYLCATEIIPLLITVKVLFQ